MFLYANTYIICNTWRFSLVLNKYCSKIVLYKQSNGAQTNWTISLCILYLRKIFLLEETQHRNVKWMEWSSSLKLHSCTMRLKWIGLSFCCDSEGEAVTSIHKGRICCPQQQLICGTGSSFLLDYYYFP